MPLDNISYSPTGDDMDGVFDKINAAIDYLNNNLNDTNVKTKVIEIGDWNMDSTLSVNIPHGLDFTKIRSISGVIRSDDNTTYSICPYHDPLLDATGAMTWILFGSTNIQLVRKVGSVFDSVNFDATSFNRGWVTIVYAV